MSRYRKIDVRMWGDSKFRSLSSSTPSGQTLWFYLLTGPHTTSIPGLFVAGPAGLAEALKWPLEGFLKAFREVIAQGMIEVDYEARVIWIPNAIHYNEPESPNVVRGWKEYWDEIPECQLKVHAQQHLKDFLEAKGEPFAKAYAEAFPKTMANQEQEQEQEQENKGREGGTDRPIETTKHPDQTRTEPSHFERFWSLYPHKIAKEFAAQTWRSLSIDEAFHPEAIIAALQSQVAAGVLEPAPGKHPLQAQNWLKGHRWDDEVKARSPPQSQQPSPQPSTKQRMREVLKANGTIQ